VLRGSVGADARTGLPQRGTARAPRPADGGGGTDAGADTANSPPSSRDGAVEDGAEDDGAAAAPQEADAPPAAANDSSGGGAMIFVLAAAALAALVAGVAAYRVRVRSRRYDELLGPVAPEQPPTRPHPRTPRSEPLNLTGSGARDRER
jgi:hypothetical protein